MNAPLEPATRPADLSNLIALADLPGLLPRRRGKKIHAYTLTRWRLSGKLPCVKLGGYYYVTPETLAGLMQPGNPGPVPQHLRSHARKDNAAQKWAREFLAARGL